MTMDPTGATVESAGAPGFVTPNWNNFDRWGDASSGILDSSGVDSGIHIQWDANSAYSSGSYINIGDGSPNSKLMDGFDSTDWAGGPPGAWTSGAVYGGSSQQKPAEYVGNIQAWLAAKGATNGYSVVLYVQGWHGWGGTSEHWIQAVTGGRPDWWNMTVGGDVTPRIYCQDGGIFAGTFSQVSSAATSLAGATTNGDYIVFNGLTNDAILIENVEPTGNYQAGKLFGFQIIATPNTPIPAQPVATPNPVYATSPLTVVEQAFSPASPVTSYQWQTDGGSGGALTNIPGATSATLNEVPVDILANYTLVFDCVVANSYGTVTSAPVSVMVYPAVAPILSRDTNPTNVYAFVGGSVTFDAGIAGSTPLTNVWQVNKGSGFVGIGSPVTTNYDLALANIQLTDAGTYQFVGTNGFGSTNSTPTRLTVQADPAAPTPSQAYAYDVFTNNPLAYWRLNEAVDPTTGNTYQAYDSSGHNLNSTYGVGVGKVGIVGPQSPAIAGFESGNTAASFTNGAANGTMVVPPLNLSSANVTITAWIYPTLDTHTGAGLLFNTTPLSSAGLGFGGNTDTNTSDTTFGQAELGYSWNNNGFNSGLFPPTNTWSFVALTITPTNGTLYLCYFDGTKTNVFKKINTRANSLEAFNSTGTTWIGGHPTSTGSTFDGSIDEVAVFNSAFTDGQVLNLYFTAQGGGSAPEVSSQPAAISGLSTVSTFAGQSVALTAYGLGYPTPSYQWQGGTGGVFHNLANDSHLSGANSGTLTIKTTMADALNYQLVLNNAYGSVTSSIATINLTPVPNNGLWTVNFAFCGGNNGMPSTPYSGLGVVGSGTFWNALPPSLTAANGLRDDGVTASGINISATNYPGNWYVPNLASPLTGLLDGYASTKTMLIITNLPNGTYNIVVYGMAGTYLDNSRGTSFTINGVTINNVFQQDWMFAPGDNSAVFANVVVSNGGLLIDDEPTGLQSDSTANPDADFNGLQIQAVSIDTVVLTNTYSGGSHGTLTLSWPSGTLVSATNVAGPWVPVAGAVSPFQAGATNSATFFRVKL